MLKVFCADKINEPVANIALIFDVTRQIKEIVSARKSTVNFLGQFFYRIFVRDVSNHDGSARVLSDAVRSYQE